jgi:hypothetical protein
MSGDYEVGYGKPPKVHRFPKGQSGNPTGSSRKARARRRAKTAAVPSVDDVILTEAYRLIQIREGDSTTSIPAIQAHMRALGLIGLKGNRSATKDFLMLAQGAERRRSAEVLQEVRTALDYKENYAMLTRLRAASGLPAPLPHPDDVLIDHRAGTVTIVGPMTEDERELLERLLAAHASTHTEIAAQQAEVEETRRLGYEPGPIEMKFIADLDAMARRIGSRFEALNWLPRLAGAEPQESDKSISRE